MPNSREEALRRVLGLTPPPKLGTPLPLEAETPETRSLGGQAANFLEALFGFRDVEGGAGITGGNIGALLSVLPILKTGQFNALTRKKLGKLAEAGKGGKDWYKSTFETLKSILGDESKAQKFVEMLSATSQNASVPANTTLAVKAYRQAKGGEEFSGYLPGVVKDLSAVQSGAAWGGPKRQAFTKNLTGDATPVTIDRWIMRAIGDSRQAPTKKEYGKLERAFQMLAEERGMAPAELQAAVWKGIKDKTQGAGNAQGSFEDYLRPIIEQPSLFSGGDPLIQMDPSFLKTPPKREPFLPARHPNYTPPDAPLPSRPPAGNPLPTRHPANTPKPVKLRHFSNQDNLTELDPAMWGTGKTDAAFKRGGPPRVYSYIKDTPYEPELASRLAYDAAIPDPKELYNFIDDPLGLVAQAQVPHYPGATTGYFDPAKLDELIIGAGFRHATDGNVVISFDKLPVKRNYANPEIQKILEKFGGRVGSQVATSPEIGSEIGRAYDQMPHAPATPEVANTYNAFQKKVQEQLAEIKASGYDLQPWTQEGQPYANSAEMFDDLRRNKRLKFFQGGDIPKDHPLGQIDPETGLSYNDMFRGVHDILAHGAEGNQFGPLGEMKAAAAHATTMPQEALPALFSETVGQNSWVNYGPHNPQALPQPQRPFAPQKAGVLPPEIQSLIRRVIGQ